MRDLERWLQALMTRAREKIPIRLLICLYCVCLPFSGLDRNQMRLAKITKVRLPLGLRQRKLFLDQLWTAFVMNKPDITLQQGTITDYAVGVMGDACSQRRIESKPRTTRFDTTPKRHRSTHAKVPSPWTTTAEPAHMPLRPRIAARPASGLGIVSFLRSTVLSFAGWGSCFARHRKPTCLVRDRDRGASLVDTVQTGSGATLDGLDSVLRSEHVLARSRGPSLQVRGNKASARQRCVPYMYAHVTCRLPSNFISCACLCLVLCTPCSH
ncbi:hypothetical protein J3F84DRAFT_178373 [Trichoderma pleuroticola]